MSGTEDKLRAPKWATQTTIVRAGTPLLSIGPVPSSIINSVTYIHIVNLQFSEVVDIN